MRRREPNRTEWDLVLKGLGFRVVLSFKTKPLKRTGGRGGGGGGGGGLRGELGTKAMA